MYWVQKPADMFVSGFVHPAGFPEMYHIIDKGKQEVYLR